VGGGVSLGSCRGETHNRPIHSFAPRSTITGIRNAALKPWKKSAHYLKAVFSAPLRIPPTLSSMNGLGVSVSFRAERVTPAFTRETQATDSVSCMVPVNTGVL